MGLIEHENAAHAALFEYAQEHWGWGNAEFDEVSAAVNVVVETLGYHQLRGAVEALREIADLPHNSATDSTAVAAERARIARAALARLGGQ